LHSQNITHSQEGSGAYSPSSLKSLWQPLAMGALLIAGIVLSFLALKVHVSLRAGGAVAPSFCNVSQAVNCDSVIGSKYSAIFGIPIAALGLAFYGWLFGLLLTTGWSLKRELNTVLFGFSSFAVLLSLGLFFLSHQVIGVLCPLCIGLYAVNALMLAVGWFGKRQSFRSLFSSSFSSLTLRAVFAAMIASGASFITLENLNAASKPKVQNVAPVTAAIPVDNWPSSPTFNFELSKATGGEGEYYKGLPGAKVYIAEFADIECPYCRQLYTELEPVLEKYAKDVFFVFKNFPLDKSCNTSMPQEGHKYACKLAEFARCAGEQGEYWEVMNLLMSSVDISGAKSGAGVQKAMNDITKVSGLDDKAVSECIASGRHLKGITRDIEHGKALKIEGTPSIFINGKRVETPTAKTISTILESLVTK
jgi:protein-disulfide isomerase